MGSTESSWKVLVVDDEEDVHLVTALALKRKEWRGRVIQLVHASSAEEARRIVTDSGTSFDVALVDVVMETREAGLELCRFLRGHCSPSLRIVLRTGQPGVAPREVVLNEYDIDYYLAKPEVTAEKLYTVIRACLRSSQDIATLLAFSQQLRRFTESLQNIASLPDLLLFMSEGLKFLELKHSCAIQFIYDLAQPGEATGGPFAASREVVEVVRRLHGAGQDVNEVVAGADCGLAPNSALVLFAGYRDMQGDERDIAGMRGAIHAEFRGTSALPLHVDSFVADARFFIENWVIAFRAVRLREHLANERMLREQMYLERVEGIAHMVAGVAHEINTPLGVANTSSSLIRSMIRQVKDVLPREQQSTIEDLEEACTLLERNIKRADNLVRSFRQLSASQLADKRATTNLLEVVADCVASLSPELHKQELEVKTHADSPETLDWDGYPGHLSQVIINLVQNAAKYAYDGKAGVVDILLSAHERSNGEDKREFELKVRDYGAGIDDSVLNRIFEPFVTTRGTGLGLAIVHNIVTNLLDGTISYESKKGHGATFTVRIPAVVPDGESKTPAVVS
jgi:signal transduction histidine kinase/CheY-like chemotaxis protein